MSSECEYDWYWKISACSTHMKLVTRSVSINSHSDNIYISVLTLWRHTRPAVTWSIIRPTCLSKTNHYSWNGYFRHIEVVCNGLVSHSSLNHIHCSLAVILMEPWHRRSCENSNFQNGKLFTLLTAQLMTGGDLNALFDHGKTRSWDGKLTFRNFFVTEQDVIVCLVRINAFHAIIDVNDEKK